MYGFCLQHGALSPVVGLGVLYAGCARRLYAAPSHLVASSAASARVVMMMMMMMMMMNYGLHDLARPTLNL
jgi:hypothetical protein